MYLKSTIRSWLLKKNDKVSSKPNISISHYKNDWYTWSYSFYGAIQILTPPLFRLAKTSTENKDTTENYSNIPAIK